MKDSLEWHRFYEKLPPDIYSSLGYLCCLRMNDLSEYARWYEVLYYDFKTKKWCENDPSGCHKEDIKYIDHTREGWHSVTHWMEVPKPPLIKADY
ncbi:MAG TPA: hypothetical protein VKR58_11910 [Aquella sp.]|nr:hypothetical protein [Aquella sp.]